MIGKKMHIPVTTNASNKYTKQVVLNTAKVRPNP